jgi:hypothetical protein
MLSVSDPLVGWMTEELWIDSWQVPRDFIFSNMSRLALEPTKPPVQWVPGSLSLQVNSWDIKMMAELNLVPWLRMYRGINSYLHGIRSDNFTFTL